MNWIEITILIVIIIGVSGFFIYILSEIINEYFHSKWMKEFKGDFEAAVKHSSPSWEEIKEIAATRYLTQNKIQKIIREAHREILTGRDSELEPHKDVIKSYIKNYEKAQPFEGIPNDLRIHLERLREKLGENIGLLDPLTSQIKDLVAVNEKERKHQKFYTVAGFFIGLLGVAIALYTNFNETPLNNISKPAVESSKDSGQSTVNNAASPDRESAGVSTRQ